MESPAVTFQSHAVAPLADLAEAWRRVRDRYWFFAGITALGMLVGGAAPMAILLGPMMCGMYLCFREQFQGRAVPFNTLFGGFKQPMLLQSVLATLVMVGVGMVLFVPFMIVAVVLFVALAGRSSGQGGEGLVIAMVAGGFVLWMLLASLVGMIFAFAYPLIADRKLDAWPAVTLSLRAVLANFGGMLGLSFLTFLLGLAGMMCCYVGVFLVLPVTLGSHMVAYEKVFGIADVM